MQLEDFLRKDTILGKYRTTRIIPSMFIIGVAVQQPQVIQDHTQEITFIFWEELAGIYTHGCMNLDITYGLNMRVPVDTDNNTVILGVYYLFLFLYLTNNSKTNFFFDS